MATGLVGASATGNIHLINNRQGGRRRGRGGQRPQGMSGNTGNARDNRQRGNAAQLLEKYKSLARDAQLAGDRVQTEYYLQFADHYFRVLEDSRARFEEQQGQRRPRRDDDEDDVEGNEEMGAGSDDDDGETEVRQRPQQRRERPERPQRDRFAGERGDRPQPRERANGAGRDEDGEGEERISLGVLPPSIGASDNDGEEEAPKPRRRVRKAKAEEEGDDIAPAA